jgi:ATP-binding cassette subfamily B multidrug efflux pump
MQKNLWENFRALWRSHRFSFLKGFLMVLTANVLLILNPLLFRKAVIATSQPEGEASTRNILLWAGTLLSIAAISAFFKYRMRMELIAISREAEKELRARIFKRIQMQSQAFYDRYGTGELLSMMTNDIAAYRDMIGPGITFPLFFVTLAVPGIFALFYISSFLAPIAMIPLIVIPLLNSSVRSKIYHYSQSVQQSLGEMSNVVQEHFTGIRIIKSYVIENKLLSRLRKLFRSFASLAMRLACYQGLLFPIFTLCTKMVTIFLVMVSGIIIFGSWQKLSVGDFISFMWIQSYLFIPVLMMSWVLPIYERGSAAYNRLLKIYEEPIEVKGSPDSSLKIPANADISFRNLTFTYPKMTEPAISHLNLTFKGGSVVGITGPIGSGKTTLLRLINRDYEIPHDMLYIGDHEVHEYSLEAFREEVVIVEQTSFLFSKSLAENVRFGKADATQEEIEDVTRYASLHDEIMGFPHQYETVVGERGVTLSGGQKQRVAIARALLVNRSLLLLDDVFSAVDLATERHIFNAIKEHFSGRTVLLVTHRVSILEQMDRVVYMMQGKAVEDGTPAELMAKGGYYAALAEFQNITSGERT